MCRQVGPIRYVSEGCFYANKDHLRRNLDNKTESDGNSCQGRIDASP